MIQVLTEEVKQLLAASREAAFALESVAHLRGLEKELLHISDALRNAMKKVQDTQ